MSYLVLARKWRPQTFTDLVGQEHVRRTLENAIAQDRVAHAFLFTGVRGVGKTTSARILAKALSCVNGPTASPCLACPACIEIAAGNDVDVQEIDGASYNGVDEVRRLQESLPYRPQRDRFKIFIVDEVHMLSQAAWNAFLKTLEEPPPHVKFIFATTEVHKVPVTILSRCQRYDFKTIAASTIGARLRYVLGEEKIEADDAAVSLIAREAAGSMRDAMSLLDQAIAWGGEKLVGEEVARVLGVASRSVLHRLAEALVAGRAEESLTIVSQLVENGYDLSHVARDLLLQLRDLVVARVCADPGPLLDMPQEERDMTVALAKTTSADDLVRLHQGFSRAFDEILKSGLPRAGLEMALVRLARRPAMVPVDELIGRLGELERRLGGGGGGAPRPGGPGGAGPSRAGGGGPPVSGGGGGGGGGGGPRPGPPAGRAQGQGPASGPFAMAAPSASSAPTHEGMPSSRGGAAIALAPPAFAPPAPRPSTVPPPRPMAVRREPPPDFGPPPSRPAPSSNPRPSARPAMPTIIHDPSAPLPPPRPGVDMDTWKRVVQRVREGSISFASILELAAPLTVGAEGVVIGFSPGSFAAAQASEPKHTELLTRAARAELGDGASVSIELTPEADGALTLARINAAEQWERREAARKRVVGHPLVQAAMELLGAELQDVRLDDGLPRLQSRSLPGKG